MERDGGFLSARVRLTARGVHLLSITSEIDQQALKHLAYPIVKQRAVTLKRVTAARG